MPAGGRAAPDCGFGSAARRSGMKCFVHNDRDATAMCPGCSRALCADCTARFTIVACEGCLLAHNRKVATAHWTRLVVTVVLFVGGVFFHRSMPVPHTPEQVLTMAVFFPSVFWGWMFLSEHTPRTFLVLPIPAWLIAITFKALVAA